VLALGSLTNVCHATAASEIIIVGGRLHSLGRWPPRWPHERNLTHDRAATHRVFASMVPLTIFPLDVAGALRLRHRQSLPMELRTQRRPLYDLAAALYAIDDAGFTFEETTAAMKANTFLRFGRGTREVKVCLKIDADALRSRFEAVSGIAG
jgi:inosine-uridine nucleoside N-ribohydrolase